MNRIVNNVYRDEHNIPINLTMRKPDPLLRWAVDESYVMEWLAHLREFSIDPNLIHFDDNMDME